MDGRSPTLEPSLSPPHQQEVGVRNQRQESNPGSPVRDTGITTSAFTTEPKSAPWFHYCPLTKNLLEKLHAYRVLCAIKQTLQGKKKICNGILCWRLVVGGGCPELHGGSSGHQNTCPHTWTTLHREPACSFWHGRSGVDTQPRRCGQWWICCLS